MTEVEKRVAAAIWTIMEPYTGEGKGGPGRGRERKESRWLAERNFIFQMCRAAAEPEKDLSNYNRARLMAVAWKLRTKLPPEIAVMAAIKGAVDA